MRKRSKYRPRAKFADPLGYVLEGFKRLAQHDDFLINLRLKNHAAFVLLARGEATQETMQTLLSANNVSHALVALEIGKEHEEVLLAGSAALLAVGRRGLTNGRFILKGPELTALNGLMDLHDAQLGSITIKELERAVDWLEREERAKRYTKIVETA